MRQCPRALLGEGGGEQSTGIRTGLGESDMCVRAEGGGGGGGARTNDTWNEVPEKKERLALGTVRTMVGSYLDAGHERQGAPLGQ